MVSDPLENLGLPDLPDYDAAQEYQALLRAVGRQVGFGIIFVRCSPERGRRLIDDLRRDLTQKHCEVLTLTDPLPDGGFFGRAVAFLDHHPADVVFVEGIEHSLLEYEETKRQSGWTPRERRGYSLKGVPPILRNLNQQRDRFRNELQACFVFLVSLFTVRYMARRAPDFFDWRSGVFEFKDPSDSIQKRIQGCFLGDYDRIHEILPAERDMQAMNIRDLLDEASISADERFRLLINLGAIKAYEGSFEDAFISWSKALDIPVSEARSFMIKGQILSTMMQSDEEAINSYDKALDLKPDDPEAWTHRGISLNQLGRYEEAIASYDKALELNPDYPNTWVYKNSSLRSLGRYGEAIASYNKALVRRVEKDMGEMYSDRQQVTTRNRVLECLWSLNYDLQYQRFRDYTLCSHRATAFVVQAKDLRIQSWLVKRLVQQVPNAANARIFSFVMPRHPMWTHQDLHELWKDISQKLKCKPDPIVIVESLTQICQTKPVIIAILGWHGDQGSRDLWQQVLRELWEPLVKTINQLSIHSAPPQLILFLAEGNENRVENTPNITEVDPRIPIPLDPLVKITSEDVRDWLSRYSTYQVLVDVGYTGEEIIDILRNEWSLDPVSTIERICDIFQIEAGIAELEPMWRLAG